MDVLVCETEFFQGKAELKATDDTRAQICYRFQRIDDEDEEYRPDLRFDYSPATKRVRALVQWAERLMQ